MRRCVARAVVALLLLCPAAQLAEAQGSGKDGAEAKAEKKAAPAPLPPGTVVAIYESAGEALRQMPQAVLLSPDRFQELFAELDRLRKLLERPVARAPSQCALKGKVAGNLAAVTLTFEFVTDQAGETVYLGCGLGRATGAALNGRTPRLTSGAPRARVGARPADEGPEGLFVEVDRAGQHTLKLDVVVGVESKPGSQSLTLDLPRAAITTLELGLPAGSSDVRLAGKPVAETLLTRKGDDLSGGLGPAEKVELSWRPARSGPASAVLSAEGMVVATFTRSAVQAEAQLRLRVLAGSTRSWQLLVPARATVEVAAADRGRVAKVESAARGQLALHTIQLKADSSEDLAVTVTTSQPAPAAGTGKAAPVGPFTAVGAARQSGTVLVSNAVADWHLEFTAHGDLTRRALTEEEQRRDANLVAAFRYGPVGVGEGAVRGEGTPWLECEAESVRGQIKARLAHALSLVSGPSGAKWQVQTTLTVSPRWADLDRLKVQLPAGWELNEEGSYPLPERVRGLSYDSKARTVELRLARAPGEAGLQPFTVRVEATRSEVVDLSQPGKGRLDLPSAPGTVEEAGGTVTVTAPAAVALVASPDGPPPGLELVRQTTHELTYRTSRRHAGHIELSWQPYRPPVQVSSLVDITLGPGEAGVRHELRYQLTGGAAPSRLALRVPAEVVRTLSVLRGGKLTEGGGGGPGDQTVLLAPTDPREPAVVLKYITPLPPSGVGAPVAIPLVAPERVTQADLRVRVWAESGGMPAAVGPGWAEQSIEEVAGVDRLPALVLRATRADQPLRLRLGPEGPATGVLVDRALVRVDVAATGVQTYRASYRLARVAGRWLDLELPGSAPSINLQLTLGDKRLDYERLPTEDPDQVGRLVRVRLAPGLVTRPTTLDITYQLTPDRMRSTALNTTLQGPRLLGEPGAAPTRWVVTTPAAWVLLAPEAGPGTPRSWGLLGWLLAPRVGLSNGDLERWLTGAPVTGAEDGGAGACPSLLLWREGGAVVRLTHVPRQAWLLGCSLALVLVMLMLGRLARSGTERGSTAAWGLGGALVLGVLVGVLLWPSLSAQVAYACQPGAAVLLLVGVFQWLVHERHRRHLVFLPNVPRAGHGSSQLRPEPPRAAAEGSTTDGARSSGSAVERGA